MAGFFDRKHFAAYGIFFGLFTLLGWFSFQAKYLDDLARHHAGTLAMRLLEEGTGIYSYLVLLPFPIWLTRRFRVTRDNWFVTLPILLGGAIAMSAAHTTLMALSRVILSPLLGLGPYDYGNMIFRYPMEASQDIVSYAIVVLAVYAWDGMASARRAELEAAELQTKLAEAQLENLRLQLNPHFLFNTLNAISSVMYEDAGKADEMIAKLSDFLRVVLDSNGVHAVDLTQELDVERMYVEIMRARLEQRLALHFNVEDDARSASVPFMILQPLLENSIRHGVDPERGALEIGVGVSRQNGSTVIAVADDGVGFSDERSSGGRGLAIVRARLRHMYGVNAGLSIARRAGGGTQAILTFPFSESNATP